MTGIPSSRWWLFGLLAAAAALRWSYLNEIRARPDFLHPGLDAGYHDYWARGLALGQWTPPPDRPDPLIRTQPYFRPPGYPYFLALVYRASGGSHVAARWAQFALGVLNVYLAFGFVRRRFGAAAGWVAGALAATYWVFIYYEGELLEPVVLITLTWLFLLALERWMESRAAKWLAAAGLALGLSALARPNALVWLPVGAAWVAWRLRGEAGWVLRGVKAALWLGAGAAVAVLPVTARNAIVGRDAVLISSNGGINLLLGQDREAVADHASSETGNWSCFDYPAILARASGEAGRPLKPSEASAWYARRARRLMLARPGETVHLLVLKTLLFWGPREVANNKIEELERAASAVLRRLPVRFSFVLAWCLVGAFVVLRDQSERRPAAVLLLLLIASYFASFLPFIAAGQYRAPLTPLLMAFAGVGLAETGRRLFRRPARGGAVLLAAGLGLWLAVGINYTGYRLNDARWYLSRAISLERGGDLAAAEQEYRAVLDANPRLALGHNRLGVVLARMDRYDEALPCFERAVALDPRLAEARFNLGLALALKNRVGEAIPHFEAVLREEPGHADARHNLAQARRMLAQQPVPLSP